MSLPWWLRRLLARLLEPVINQLAIEDPWERLAVKLPPQAFGQGSVRAFSWYFEGESLVSVESLDAICAWLTECAYVRDARLFHEADFWQHPRTFEQIRRGDCEDHALWAWRKLIELGYEAELVCGEWATPPAEPGGGHAWVVFRDQDREYLLEAVTKSATGMIRPLDEVRERYWPHVAVNGRFETTGFSGHTLSLQRQHAIRRGKGRAGPAVGVAAP